MEYIDIVIKQIIASFDFSFMFIVNVLSYLIIRIIYGIKKGKYVTTWSKRFTLMICAVVAAIVYKLFNFSTNIVIIHSAILAPVFWDWILRPILIKLNIDYKRFERYDDNVNEVIETKDTIVEVKSK